MAFDAFLKFDGITGESTSQGHEKWIELLSFNWGAVSTETTARAVTGGAVGKTGPSEFSFTKAADSASPNIFLKLCQGATIDKASLACSLAAGGAATNDFLKIDFYNVIFINYSHGGSLGSDPRPLESVSFAFSKLDFQTAPVNADGVPGSFTEAQFDFKLNKGSLTIP